MNGLSMPRLIFAGIIDEIDVEDSGMAQIAEVPAVDPQSTLFVRLQSWSDEAKHPEMDALKGKKVRITVEVVE